MRTCRCGVRVITEKRLMEFAAAHADAAGPLRAWIAVAKASTWRSLADVRLKYRHADVVGPYTVFNIKGNTYRLIVKIEYRIAVIFIKHILTHAEYEKGNWKR